MEQYSDVHSGGILDCMSASGFNFALPLTCLDLMGVLFTFARMLYSRAGGEFSLIDQFNCFINWFAIRFYEQRVFAFSQ